MTAAAHPAPARDTAPATHAAETDSAALAPTAVRINVLIVPRRGGDLATALPWFLGRAIAR